MTKVLSDARERSKISSFDKVGILFVDWLGMAINNSEASIYISWYNSGVVDDELSFDMPEAEISCGVLRWSKNLLDR